jgi:DNA modification methylase
VLDAFIGSGTTLIAAEKTGRRGYGIEIDPTYCDVAVRRLRAVCGLEAVLEATGQPFAEVAAERMTRDSAHALPQPA